jgi:hypothetical protein
VESSLVCSIPAGPATSFELGALAGYSLSQDGNFGDNGLTHADLSGAVSFAAGPLSITPALHLQLSNAAATRITSPIALDSRSKLWFGVAVGWEQVLPAGGRHARQPQGLTTVSGRPVMNLDSPLCVLPAPGCDRTTEVRFGG